MSGDIIGVILIVAMFCVLTMGIIVDVCHDTDYNYWNYEKVYAIDEVADALVSGEIDSVMVTATDSPIPMGKLIFIPYE